MQTKLLSFVLAISLLVSCQKAEIISPEAVTASPTVFKDDNISVVNVLMEQKSANRVDFSFATRYEVGINKIEVLHGTTAKYLCMFYEVPVAGDSHSLKTYPLSHNLASATVNYYMIRYYKTTGGWSYSPVYEIKMK